MYQVDINELTRNQMLATYKNEELIKKSSDDIGHIGDRF